MLHKMKLKREPFEKILSGRKTIELRLNDEKRQQVQVGDYIEFASIDDSGEKLTAVVTALHHFENFQELYASLPKEKMGYDKDDVVNPDHMDEYYSREEQEKYGVVGIELRLTDLQKFIDAQENGYMLCSDYKTALEEIRNGRKVTHWIWYIFPQIKGLGRSETTSKFAIKDKGEAVDYLSHPVLGARLKEILQVLLELETDDLMTVLDRTDALKLRSSMTLFMVAAPYEDIFQRVIDKYCMGMPDSSTLEKI